MAKLEREIYTHYEGIRTAYRNSIPGRWVWVAWRCHKDRKSDGLFNWLLDLEFPRIERFIEKVRNGNGEMSPLP